MKNRILIIIAASLCFVGSQRLAAQTQKTIEFSGLSGYSNGIENPGTTFPSVPEITPFDAPKLRAFGDQITCSVCGNTYTDWGSGQGDTPCPHCASTGTSVPVGAFPMLIILIILSYFAIILLRTVAMKTREETAISEIEKRCQK